MITCARVFLRSISIPVGQGSFFRIGGRESQYQEWFWPDAVREWGELECRATAGVWHRGLYNALYSGSWVLWKDDGRKAYSAKFCGRDAHFRFAVVSVRRESLVHPNYGWRKKIATNHPLWTNVMDNIFRGHPEERPPSAPADNLVRKMMLWLEQKSVEGMVDFMSKFCKAEKLVLVIRASNITTSNTCLQLAGLHKFVGLKSTWLVPKMRFHRLREYKRAQFWVWKSI